MAKNPPVFFLSMVFKLCFPHLLICMEDSRPQNLNLGVALCIESGFEVENSEFLHIDLENKKSTPLLEFVIYQSVMFPC